MIKYARFLGFLSLLFVCVSSNAQKKSVTNSGTVEGVVRDSIRNYSLPSATVSIYRDSDSKLLAYQLSNSFGRFSFKNIPIDTPLRIVSSYIGYKQYVSQFKILPETTNINLHSLSMERLENVLDEVKIIGLPPPVQMRGDTIEFNASAFKLDSNAVVGDLLKRLPGIIVWADGLITMNGKKINQVLVEGKPFINDDPQTALRNLPKNAVDKIQIYKNIDAFNPDTINASIDLNIRLKKGMKNGYFGKIGIGYGSSDRYAGDAMLAIYSPKTRISIVGATNNVNKTAADINTLLQFNSFSGQNFSSSYQSDFTLKGLNTFRGLGFTIDRDLSAISNIKGNYFAKGQNNEFDENSQTNITLLNGSISKRQASTSRNHNVSTEGVALYQYKSKYVSLNGENTVSTNLNDVSSSQSLNSNNTSTGQQGSSLGRQDSHNQEWTDNLHLKTSLIRHFDAASSKFKLINLDIDYILSLNNGSSESKNISNFFSSDITENKYYDRKYVSDFFNSAQSLNLSFRDVLTLLHIDNQYFKIDLNNFASLSNSRKTDVVSDLDTTNLNYKTNSSLSNLDMFSSLTEKPGLSFTRIIGRSLPERYLHRWTYTLLAQLEVYRQINKSEKAFQLLDRTYTNFTPKVVIDYTNNIYGYYLQKYSLTYNTSNYYPSIDKLVPIVDLSNIYSVDFGNPNLRSSYSHELSLDFSHYTNKVKNNFQVLLNVTAGITTNFISDSVSYDDLGRSLHYYINAANSKYEHSSLSYGQSFKYLENIYQFKISLGNKFEQKPAYINGLYYLGETSSLTGLVNLSYSYGEKINLSSYESFNKLVTKQGESNSYEFKTWTTGLSTEIKWPKNIFLISKISYNKAISSYANDINYTIWNIDLGYRFFKGNNGEIKFSALDILRQNKNIIFYTNNNSITRGTINVLRQYFMITLAYYPRQFGSAKSKKQ